MDQSQRPGRWVQIFVLVSIICGVSQICSLAQNAPQPENAASEAATEPESAASKKPAQASSSDAIPDIKGVWTEEGKHYPTDVGAIYFITAAPAGSSQHYQWFKARYQPPGELIWLPKQKLFEMSGSTRAPNYKILVQPSADHNQIKFFTNDKNLDWPLVMDGLANPETAGDVLKEFKTVLFQYRGQYGRIESGGLILAESAEGMAAYSKSLGRWDKIQIPLAHSHRPRLIDFAYNLAFAAAAIDDQLIGYSAAHGRWSSKTIPAQQIGKVDLAVGNQNTPNAQVGDKLYALSSTTGKWTSPDDAAAKVDESPKVGDTTRVGHSSPRSSLFDQPSTEPTVTAQDFRFSIGTNTAPADTPVAAVPQIQLNSAEAQALSKRLASQEQSAANLAEQIRKQASTLGNDHPTTKSLRAQLASALSAALDSKFELELLQVTQLQSQLSRLQEQIGQRKAQRQKIIDRRINELIEDDATNWNNIPPVGTPSRGRGEDLDDAAELASLEFSADELYERGMNYLKRGRSRTAYDFFKAASESGQSLNPVLSHQLNVRLRELAPSSVAPKSSSSTVVPTPHQRGFASPVGIDTTGDPQKTGIQFSGPKRTTVYLSYDQEGHRMSGKLPDNLELPANSQTVIEFVTSQELRFVGYLTISPIKPHTKFFWDKRDIQLSIDDEDLTQLAAAKPVKKVVYLPERSIASHNVNSDVETVVSTRLESGIDPVTEADRRGAILLSLSLSPGKTSAPGKTALSSKEQSVSLAQKVSFSGPEGLEICGDPWKGQGPSYSLQPLPHTHQVRRPSEVQPEWRFFLPGTETVFGTLYVPPVKTQTRAYWLSNAAPLTITREDLSEAGRGDLVTKVVYLSEDSIRNPQNAIAETLETTGLANENPVEEADRRGAVLAVLHLSQHELSPQVRLTGPQGLSVLQQSNNWTGSLPITREELSASGSQHAFEFTSQDNQKFYGSLNVSSVKGHTQFFWQTQVPQIEFTQAEIDQLASEGLITKAFYLSENSIRNPSQAHLESVNSLTSPPGTDVVSEADVRGAVLAVLKLAPTRERLTLPNASGTKSASSTSNEQSVESGQFGRTPFQFGGPAPLRSKTSADSSQPITGTPSGLDAPNIDAVVRFRNAQAAVRNAKERLELIENGSPANDKFLPDAKLELDRAQRQQDSVLKELNFSVRDLELQIESSKLETELLVQEQKRMEKLNSAAAATPSEVGTARLKATKSITALERLKLRFEYLKNVIEDMNAKPPQENQTEEER